MSPPRDQSSTERPSETTRTASRGAIYWIVPIALAALAILFVGIHFVGGIK